MSWRSVFLVFSILYLFTLIWVKMVYELDRQPYFIDEVSDTLAAQNFIETGDYTSVFFNGGRKFGPGLSVGFASSWPGGLTWALGGNLFQSRFALAIVGFLEGVILFFLFFRMFRIRILESIALSLLIWLATLQTPYWYGFIINVGELSGALAMAWGMFLLHSRPRLAFFVLGIGVWSCKFIYLPLVVAWYLAYLFLHRKTRSLSLFAQLEGMFFLPLLIWLGIIVLRYDFSSMWTWIQQFVSFVVHGNSGLDGAPPAVGLSNRLESPSLEWSGYDLRTRARMIFLFLGPSLLFLFLPRFFKTFSRVERGFVLASLAVLNFYLLWYFLWSPTMMIRHAQPGMYLGFGILVWAATKGIFLLNERWTSGRGRKLLLGVVGGLLLIILGRETQTFLTRFPILLPYAQSYPRNCQDDLTGISCIPEDLELPTRPVQDR